jgi:hypothetical protein
VSVVGALDRLVTAVLPRPRTTAAATVVEPAPRPQATDALVEAIARQRLSMLGRDSALSIPAVRKALHVLVGTISTFDLQLWRGSAVIPGPAWMTQPERGRTLPSTLAYTIQDLIWFDHAHWEVKDSYVDTSRPVAEWFPSRFAYISAERVLPVHDPDDVDAPGTWLIDGQQKARLVTFDGHGLGGLRLHGLPMLALYDALMAAASRYAESPMPSIYLRNTGADLDQPEIDALLDSWDSARVRRATAYLNSVLQAETLGWSAKDLQLTEAREHAATEIARLFGLPAFALDAPESDSMTYGNVTDKRRDIAEALRPWLSVVEAALSTNDVVPRGQRTRFAVDAYIRDDPKTRMETWAAAAGVLTLDEIRAAEPLATGVDPPTPAPPPAPAPPAASAAPDPPGGSNA